MSAEVAQFDEAWARRITERIRYSAIGVRDGLEKLQSLMAEAQSGNAHELLGYVSWTAYISEVMGEEPLRLARDERRDLVAWLSGQGMSTRAIAPIVGVDNKTVHNDIKARVEISTPDPNPVQVDGFTVDQSTGEIIDSPQVAEPTVTEHTFTEKIKTVTGLDGKTYKRPEPKPVPTGDDANRANAVQAAKSIGRSLEALQYLNYDNARHGIVTDWWPLGRHEVPPEQAAYFTPAELRKLAQGLNQTADLLEAHHVD